MPAEDGETQIRLVRYRPSQDQPLHAHDGASIAVLLAGEIHEASAGRDYDLDRHALCWKPAGLGHANRYGPQGALVASIPVTGDAASAIALAPGWHVPFAFGPLAATLRVALCGRGLLRSDAVADLLSAGYAAMPSPARPPRWLAMAKAMLRDDPEHARVADAAAAGGVHRIHLHRMFRHHYATTPSAYRLRSMAAKALALAAAPGTPVSDAALGAGFADQSHASRAIRGATGFTFGEIARLLA